MGDLQDVIYKLGASLMDNYWRPMYNLVKNNPELIPIIPGFLIKPDRIIFYLGQTHIGVEYVGPERIKELPVNYDSKIEVQCFDYTSKGINLLDEIIGFNYGDKTFKLPLPDVSYNLVFPTNAGADELERLNWNWTA